MMVSAPLFAAFAVMAALAVLAVLWPLGRSRTEKAAREADLAVYRDQLAEISRDTKSGWLPPDLADAARVEVARRMLAADSAPAEDTAPADTAPAGRRRRIAAVVALVLVPVAAVTTYGLLGSPDIPGAPLAERLAAPPERGDVAILVRRVEEHLAKNPNDGQGYELLAPVYMRLGRPEDAVRAYAMAIRLLGPSAERQSALGEALTVGANGIVTADAVEAFKAAAALDPTEPRASYFLGLAAEQDGRPQEAARIWTAMAEQAPPNAPYLPMLRAALARVGAAAPASKAPAPPFAPPALAPAAPGPSAADVAAASQMSDADRNAMVRGMVDRLEARLKDQPDDLDGWLRLARAFGVLKETEKAKAALASARSAFADKPDALGRIDAAEKALASGE